MSTVVTRRHGGSLDYPTSDGKPMAETDWHRQLMTELIETLQVFFAGDPQVYVSGNLLLFYVPNDRRRHLSPDVFVVKGVPKMQRPNYLTWEEGKGPDIVIELTSSSTRNEDLRHKFTLYQDTLRVSEYFLFDPLGDYLDPPMRGYRLRGGKYQPIRLLRGRLTSRTLGLQLERHGEALRLFDPATGQLLPTPRERLQLAESHVEQAEARVEQAEARVERIESENERLRKELDELRRRQGSH